MSQQTIIALAIFGLVFLLMAITLIKYGTAAAVQLWSVMGALTGVAFGGITTYYFTNQANQGQITQARLEAEKSARANDSLVASLKDASKTVTSAKATVSSLSTDAKHENPEVVATKLNSVSQQLAAVEDASQRAVAQASATMPPGEAAAAPAAAPAASAEPPR